MTEPSPSIIPHWTARQVVVGTLFVVTVLMAFWLLYQFRLVIFILFVAAFLGIAIRPAVEWLHRRNIPRPVGIIAIYLLLLLLIIGFGLLFVPLLVEQLTQVSIHVPRYYFTFRDALVQSPSRLIQQIGFRLPTQIFSLMPEAATDEEALDRVGIFFTAAGVFVRGTLATITIFLLGFYWTLESERTVRSLLLFFPTARRERIRELIAEIESRVGGYIRGQVLLSTSIFILAFISYLLIGLQFPLVLAIIAGIMEVIPIFGPVLGAIPAILVALSQDPSKVILVIIATVVMQSLENYLLVPRIMKQSVGVNPIVTLLALAAFTSLLGLPGALLAVPVAAIIQLLLNRFVIQAENQEEVTLTGRDQVSLLRYEAQDLASDVRKQLRQKEDLTDQDVDRVEDDIEAIAAGLDRILAEMEDKGASQ
jgi:predicted PurR-regulated permease PerM